MGLLFLMGGWNLLPVFCFIHKNVGSSSLKIFYEEPYQTCLTAVKTLKNQNDPTNTQKKNQILLHRFLDEYT